MIPQLIGYFIDHIIPQNDKSKYLYLIAALVGMFIFVLVAQMGKNLLQRSLREKASKDLQISLLEHLRRKGFAYFEQQTTGKILSMMNSDTAAVNKIFKVYLPNVIDQGMLICAAFFFVLRIDYQLSLIVVPCLLLYLVVGPFFERKVVSLSRESADRRGTLNQTIMESISSQYELRAHSREKWNYGNLVTTLNSFTDVTLKSVFFNYFRETIRRLIVYLGVLALFIIGTYKVRSGDLTIGDFVIFTFYYFIMIRVATNLFTYFAELKLILPQAEILYRFMGEAHEVKEPEQPVVLPQIRGDIRLTDVRFAYPGRAPILRGLQLHIRSGEKVALVGRSGNGKSTIIKLIGRFYDPFEGNIALDDVPLNTLSLSQIRDAMGFVFQDTYLYGASVLENIMFGNPNATKEEVISAAKSAYAHDFIMKLPHQYETILGERGTKLSGGQRQRLAIARMIVKNPKIILLDEATSALDNVSEAEVKHALDRLLEGRTTIAVAHRISTVRDYDRIALIEDGHVKEIGSYQELMQRGGLFKKLLEGEVS
jgi:ATP-binding cassette subfamily B protein/subfamily B ATP-binding cassette protein MsbA